MRFCTQCGTQVSDNDVFCMNCGSRLEPVRKAAPAGAAQECPPLYDTPAAEQEAQRPYERYAAEQSVQNEAPASPAQEYAPVYEEPKPAAEQRPYERYAAEQSAQNEAPASPAQEYAPAYEAPKPAEKPEYNAFYGAPASEAQQHGGYSAPVNSAPREQQFYAGQQPAYPEAKPKSDVKGLLALIFGIVSLAMAFFGIFGGVTAFIGLGLAIAGMILGSKQLAEGLNARAKTGKILYLIGIISNAVIMLIWIIIWSL